MKGLIRFFFSILKHIGISNLNGNNLFEEVLLIAFRFDKFIQFIYFIQF